MGRRWNKHHLTQKAGRWRGRKVVVRDLSPPPPQNDPRQKEAAHAPLKAYFALSHKVCYTPSENVHACLAPWRPCPVLYVHRSTFLAFLLCLACPLTTFLPASHLHEAEAARLRCFSSGRSATLMRESLLVVRWAVTPGVWCSPLTQPARRSLRVARGAAGVVRGPRAL